jgi:hypothetical protein
LWAAGRVDRPVVPIDDASGAYEVTSLGLDGAPVLTGRVVLLRDEAGYQMMGLGFIARPGRADSIGLLSSRVTVLPDGRMAADINGPREGGHLGGGVFALVTPPIPLPNASGPALVVLEPVPVRLSGADGVYDVAGELRADSVMARVASRGTVAAVRLGAEARTEGVLVLAIALRNEEGSGGQSFTTMGYVKADGAFETAPITMDDGAVMTATGQIGVGQVQLLLATADPRNVLLNRHIRVAGTKRLPAPSGSGAQ